jgi:hypothetical protein
VAVQRKKHVFLSTLRKFTHIDEYKRAVKKGFLSDSLHVVDQMRGAMLIMIYE